MVHISFGEAVPSVVVLRIHLDAKLEDFDRLGYSLRLEQLIPEANQFTGAIVVCGRLSRLQVTVLLYGWR
jgi:hypothetical protein